MPRARGRRFPRNLPALVNPYAVSRSRLTVNFTVFDNQAYSSGLHNTDRLDSAKNLCERIDDLRDRKHPAEVLIRKGLQNGVGPGRHLSSAHFFLLKLEQLTHFFAQRDQGGYLFSLCFKTKSMELAALEKE